MAGAVAVFLGDSDPGPAEVPGALALGLLFGGPTGGFLGLGLALLPAVATGFVRAGRQARVAAASTYAPVAVLVVAAQLNDGVQGQESYAAMLVAAALFGLWRCQRSAALAVRRVTRRRAEAVPARPLEPRPAQAS